MRAIVRRRLIDRLEEEMRVASGLVDERREKELFDRYVMHVSVWVKGETIRNPHTGEHEKADEKLMREVEGLLGVTAKHDEHRRGLISYIAAWAIDHPGQKVQYDLVFPDLLKKLKEAVFADRRKPVALLVRDLVRILRERKRAREIEAAKAAAAAAAAANAEVVIPDPKLVEKDPALGETRDLGEGRRREAAAMLARLIEMGYDESSAQDAAMAVLRGRFAELVA
jgi:predicted Ser/Thr protein kinase